ncbi:MAG TPA: SCP2 sterol-binding domain-containing protein [Acidimicrobiales bacterium]|nr:SCP2 sterol-binding domain-containing protein [Acidimicrobiales bacterium]
MPDDAPEPEPATEAGPEPAAYPFLSDEWIDAARAIREEFRDRVPAGEHSVRLNQVITEVPFGEGTVLAYVDTSSGQFDLEIGQLDDAEVSITLDYATARAVFLDPQSAIQHFMAGKIKIQGDMTKLVLVVQSPPDALAGEAHQRISEITA